MTLVDGYFCTTQNILDLDPSAAMLCATPNAPNFDPHIKIASDYMLGMFRQLKPRITWSQIGDPSQLTLACCYKVLSMLYRTAVIQKGSAASSISESYDKDFNSMMKQRIDTSFGESVAPGFIRGIRF